MSTDNQQITSDHAGTDSFIDRSEDGGIERIKDFQYTTLGMLILYRLVNDRDMKIIITSSGSTTGTGKTTLAIVLCHWVRQVANDVFDMDKDWSAEEYGTVNLWEYLQAYKNSDPGDALLMDEIENAADKRRHMSKENVGISQAWSILRYQNVVTVSTLPTVSMLDSRMMELADVWINVIYPGHANVYYITVNDFDHDLVLKRLKKYGRRESIKWPDLSGHPDYEYLKQEKEGLGVPGIDNPNENEEEQLTETDLNKREKSVREEIAKNLLETKGEYHTMNQTVMGEIVGRSQQWISDFKREI